MKVCTKCKVEKKLDEFQSEKRKADRRSSRCKECLNEDKRQYLDKKREKIREYNREKYYENHEVNKRKRTEHSRKIRSLDNGEIAEYKKEWWKKHAVRLREKQNEKKKTPEFREYRRNYVRNRLREEEVIKVSSRKLLRAAIKLKRLIRPDKCSKCGKECKPHGHHEDYTKPLEVVWLCRICHNHAHGKLLDIKP